jgi:tetratricopeptide (TPR) repeat protein
LIGVDRPPGVIRMQTRALAMAMATVLAAGCGGGRARSHAVPPLPTPSMGSPAASDDPSSTSPDRDAATAPESFDSYIARVRVRAQQAVVARTRSTATSVEAADPMLRDALDRLSIADTPDRRRAAAAAYLHAGIVDKAFDQFTAALRLDRTDAAAYDGLARIWRDWGFPHLGLTDAHRAVYHAPQSPAARNTLGTLFQALGLTAEARRAYEAAVTLDPRAAYALSNLCALDLAEGRLADAAAACDRALEADETLLAARRNLALVRALQPVSEPVNAERGSGDGTSRPPRE